MSKKKRLRKEVDREFAEFAEVLGDLIEAAQIRIEDSTPFELSLELAELGAQTTHLGDIHRFMKEWQPPAGDSDPLPPHEAMARQWEAEIEKSRGERPGLEDSVFLNELARFYWEERDSKIYTGPMPF